MAKKKTSQASKSGEPRSELRKTSKSKRSTPRKDSTADKKKTSRKKQPKDAKMMAKGSPAAKAMAATGAGGSGGDGQSTAARYMVVIQVNWEDETTGQIINNFRVEVFDSNDEGARSISKDMVLAQLPKIVAVNGGAGWPYKQSNGKISS